MTSKYQMWLTHNGGLEQFRFPVLPELLSVNKGNISKKVNVLNLGEIIIKGDPQAATITFSSFFPAEPFPGIQYAPPPDPNTVKEMFERFQESFQPIRWFITGLNVGAYFRIENFNYYWEGGDVGTLHYTLALKEYKEVKARQVRIDPKTKRVILPPPPVEASNPFRTDNRVVPKTHLVVEGDSLWKIASYYYNDGERWSEIYNFNRGKIDNPLVISAGQVFVIP